MFLLCKESVHWSQLKALSEPDSEANMLQLNFDISQNN